jgi:hypothetical protein
MLDYMRLALQTVSIVAAMVVLIYIARLYVIRLVS